MFEISPKQQRAMKFTAVFGAVVLFLAFVLVILAITIYFSNPNNLTYYFLAR